MKNQDHVKHYNTSTDYIIDSVDKSLQALKTVYIDLLLIHRPDALTDPDQIVAAFKKLKQEGKVFHFGVSNYTPSQISLLRSRLPKSIPLVTNQIQFNNFHLGPLNDGSFDYLQKKNISPQIWAPFAGGKIFNEPTDPQTIKLKEVLLAIAKKLNTDFECIVLAWILKHPSSPSVVLGSTNLKRIETYAKALSLEMSREDWFTIFEASRGIEVD